jgi:hypothetical protein
MISTSGLYGLGYYNNHYWIEFEYEVDFVSARYGHKEMVYFVCFSFQIWT